MRQLLGEHTPGPWERVYGGFDGVELESKDDFLRFCAECWDKTEASGERQNHLHCIYSKDDKGEEVIVAIVGNGPKSEANARLIAAAPDLLEACNTAINGEHVFETYDQAVARLERELGGK